MVHSIANLAQSERPGGVNQRSAMSLPSSGFLKVSARMSNLPPPKKARYIGIEGVFSKATRW
ncbi:hypothetical protein D3C72_2344150 [compost metagenome]